MKNTASQGGLIPVEALTAGRHEEEEFSEEGVEISESSRRRFVSLMAGSLALAGLTGCTRQPTETIMPYVDPPENVIPGKPKYYVTAVPGPGSAQGVLVESHLGRPTKVEGNPDHPASFGATSVQSQACLMDLYDPDRAKEISYLGDRRTWGDFQVALAKAIAPGRAGSGNGLRILTETVVSPTLGNQIAAVLKALPAAKWHQFEPAGAHSARVAAQIVFGKPLNTFYNFSDANVVVALDADFLACGTGSTRYARDFANHRRRGNRLDMNRLYAIESTMTATGGKADHRLAVRYSEVEACTRELASAVGASGGSTSQSSSHSKWVQAAGRDLIAHKGSSLVIPGEHQSPNVHALAHAINLALGNVGKAVLHTDPIEVQAVDQIAFLRQLTDDMNAGHVELLLILGGNPVYNAPVDFAFTKALEKVKTAVHVSLHLNETSLKILLGMAGLVAVVWRVVQKRMSGPGDLRG